jgi:sporulation protein YlmC with PRC-barrel domain
MGIVEETQVAKNMSFVPATEIKGSKVVNVKEENQEENLGTIEEVMIDPEHGRIAYVVLSFGGLLGMGNKLFAIPWESLEYNRGDYILRLDKSILEKAEGFDEEAWALTRDELSSIYKRCGIQPYWK